MRGKESIKDNPKLIIRITPAYAGKSGLSLSVQRHAQDHPRLCGEKLKTAVKDGVYTGSPPPMRGKDSMLCRHLCLLGITPAYAGKSPVIIAPCLSSWDHPRLCGEK